MQKNKLITSNPLSLREYWKQLVSYRSLIWVFAIQEMRTIYAQTYLGLFWAIVRPIFTLIIFTIIFSFFLHVPTQSPYYLFAFCGMIAWNLFSQIATNASTAVLQKQNLIRKMYFPKLILPLSKVLIVLIEAGISVFILFILLCVERINAGTNLLALPVFLLLNVVCGFAVAIWMNAINIQFRDLNQILPTIIGIGVWVTPVFYPTTIIPKEYEFFVYLNPMAGIIKGYRYALLGESFPSIAYWWSILLMAIIMFAGIIYFSKVEDRMVDYA